MRLLLPIAALCALLAVACAINPVTGRPEMVLVSAEKEREVGREEAKNIEATMGIAEHARARAYVRAIGRRLAVHSPRQDVEYTFDVVDTPEPNAFALPGGPVYVSRGLLALANSEDELAGVIGHEIGHIAARHVVQRVSVTAPLAVVVGIPSAIVGMVSKPLGRAVAAPGALAMASHSRGQEHDADRIGIDLAAASGYDPSALPRILETMEREAALQASERRRSHFFDSHPATEDRVERAAKHATGLAVGAPDRVAPDRAGTLAQLAGLRVGENPAYGVFLDQRFVHPELGFSLDFPTEWKTLNQPLYVVGVAPESDQRAFAMLQLAAEGSDPREGARADGLDPKLIPSLELMHVNGLPATRVISAQKQATFHLTWIALGDSIYRVACVAETAQWPRYVRACEDTAASFRPLASKDRSRIREEQLRVVRARPGEDLGRVVGRADSTWDAERAAIANALAGPTATLPAGFGVKLAVSRPYAPSQ